MLLALNTCGVTGSVALGRLDLAADQIEILGRMELAARAYSAELIPQIAKLLADRQATIAALQAVVVVRGPGSFTGIRVGLSTAKGLAEAAGIPIIAISRLALLASASGLPHVLAAVDAGRGEYYVGDYRDGENLGEMLLGGMEARALAERPGAGVLVCEETPEISRGADLGTGMLRRGVLDECSPVYLQAPHAADALRLALDRFRAGSFENLETLDGNYLRRSDAELFSAAASRGEKRLSGA